MNTPLKEYPPLRGLEKVKYILAVASGKGGVGKSTVTVLLGRAFQKLGLKVGIADSDIYGASIPALLGVNSEPEVTDERMLIPPEVEGLACLSMAMLLPEEDVPVIWRGPMLHKMVHQFLFGAQWGERDVLLIDLPPGTGDVQLTITQTVPVSGAIIVTTPQAVSLLDVQKGLSMFDLYEIPLLGVVENMSYFACPQCQQKEYPFPRGGLDELLDKYRVPKLYELPLSEEMAALGEGEWREPEWLEDFGRAVWEKIS